VKGPLAVSVSQFGLSFCLNQFRQHPSSRSRKISPFPSQQRSVLWPQLSSALECSCT